uniref:CTCK domain-containing protein n=1 Tax=Elaeophora elaphi TaxID=1147741 RepID=A0A0R3RRV4_9BILA
MTSHDNSVIISGTDNLDTSSVELVSAAGITEHEPVQQHQDADTSGMSYTTVPLEVLEVAGIDIENSGELTEEQINTIMSLIEPSGATQQHGLKQEQADIPLSSYANSMPSSSSETGDRLTLYILDDGSLKLTDAALQKEFFFTPRDLALHSIDVDNLTDETLQRVIQMAMESFGCTFDLKIGMESMSFFRNEVVVMKKRRMEDVDPVEFTGSSFLANTSMESPASAASKRALVRGEILVFSFVGMLVMIVSEEHHADSQLSLIGTEVEIKRDGKVYSATIKYCRQSGGYKVQFSDGHFEWVGEDEIRLLHDENPRKHSDHESYSERVGTVPSGGTISKNIDSRRCTSQIPGIKVIPTNGCLKQEEPNFCCAVCDQKVYQREPQYIVIRIPACDRCAEQKMILLDGTTKDCEAQTCASVLKSDLHITAVAKDEQRRS